MFLERSHSSIMQLILWYLRTHSSWCHICEFQTSGQTICRASAIPHTGYPSHVALYGSVPRGERTAALCSSQTRWRNLVSGQGTARSNSYTTPTTSPLSKGSGLWEKSSRTRGKLKEKLADPLGSYTSSPGRSEYNPDDIIKVRILTDKLNRMSPRSFHSELKSLARFLWKGIGNQMSD